ncbi:MAG: hypothetical protein OEZ01_11195 [Candidatus Heimdallarchaeota archaeon]|nr:hypothetical protein [Candidatus Heimdallarchaeota archaeon]MDH5646567.1 hypothetical protein [Candidatus Heimdallarchaeota archaeon]
MKDDTQLFKELWDFRDPVATHDTFIKLLNKIQVDDDPNYYIQLLTQIARTFSLRLIFDKAHEFLDKVFELLNTYPAEDLTIAWIRYYLELGRTHNSNNEKEQARKYFLNAWELAKDNNVDGYAVDAAHMMGIAEVPENQLEWNMKAIKFAEQSDSDSAKGWLGPLYNNTGWSYHDLGEYQKAMDLFKASLQWREDKKDLNGTLIAKWTIARTYRSMQDINKALELQLELKLEREQHGLMGDGYNFEEIAECYLLKGEDELAKKYFKRAFELLSNDPWLVKNENTRLDRLKTLSL